MPATEVAQVVHADLATESDATAVPTTVEEPLDPPPLPPPADAADPGMATATGGSDAASGFRLVHRGAAATRSRSGGGGAPPETLLPAAALSAPTAVEDVSGVPGGLIIGDASPAAPSSQHQSSVSNNEIVLGTPITDNGITRVVRRVIILAAFAATYYIVHFIFNLLSGNYSSSDNSEATSLWAATSSLLIELSIPACGYLGALYNNRQLTCCFCSCNLFIAIVSIMSFIRVHVRIGELAGNCAAEENVRQRRTCEAWMADGTEKYLLIMSTLIIVLLGCLASWFGNSLYNMLARDSHSLNVPLSVPLVGEVISLTPSPSSRGQGAMMVWDVLGAAAEASPSSTVSGRRRVLSAAGATASAAAAAAGREARGASRAAGGGAGAVTAPGEGAGDGGGGGPEDNGGIDGTGGGGGGDDLGGAGGQQEGASPGHGVTAVVSIEGLARRGRTSV